MLETFHPRQSMIRKSGYRFSEKIMLKPSMIRKSGYRFSEKDHAQTKRRVEQIAVTGACSSEIGGNSRGVSTQRRGDTRCLLSRLRRFLRRSAAARFLRSSRNNAA